MTLLTTTDILFDRIINVTFRSYTTAMDLTTTDFDETVVTDEEESLNDAQVLTIECPEWGPKPDISVQFMSVEGHFSFNVALTIVNFSTSIDVKVFREMSITAGYSNPSLSSPLTVTYVCPIFTSYIETPNPGGRTVFTGIAARSFQHLLSPKEIRLVFYDMAVTLEELCTDICGRLGLTVEFDWPDELLQARINFGKQEYYGRSGYSLLNWLLTQLQSLTYGDAPIINSIVAGQQSRYITIAWIDNTLRLGLSGYTRDPNALTIIDVNRITSAEITGGILTVTAPWNPKVQPGSVIRMSSIFFRGRSTPNVARADVIPDDGLYTVIIMNVDFSTVGNNQMTIKAVAAPSNESEGEDGDEDGSGENQTETETENEENGVTGQRDVTLADAEASEKNEAIIQQEFGTKPTETASFSYDWSGGGSDKYLVQPGDTLSELARDWWPDLHYYKPNVDKRAGVIIPEVDDEKGYTGRYFWPTIFFATQYAMKNDKSFYVNPQNPDDLRVGTYLIKPNWSDPDSISGGAALFRAAADCYEAMKAAGYPLYQDMGAQDFRQIADFMEAE